MREDVSGNSGGDTFGSLFRKNKRLTRELAKIESFFNAMNSAVLVVDRFGAVSFANDYAGRIFPSKNFGESVFKLVPAFEDAVKAVAESGMSVRREFEIDYPERRMLSVRVIAFNLDDAENFAIIANDITREKISEREQIESEKISSVLNLAGGVAHELGNPLNSIGIHLQLVRRALAKPQELSPERKAELSESVEVCISEVKRLDMIIENFLKALRPIRPDVSECDALTPLAETLNVLSRELSDIGIKVSVKADSALPKILADKNLLKQLYFNILRNAMEAMDGGGAIDISASSDDEFVRITFSDTGCGMDESALSRLFEPYFTTKPNGHGLGMMIIRSIVRAHNGKIDVESKKGVGTKISVSLPRFEKLVRRIASADSGAADGGAANSSAGGA